MNLDGLRRELDQRAARPVRFHHWDPYILGDDDDLRSEVLPAGEIGTREAMRWRKGRFPSIQLAVADAVFSKQREYSVAVRTAVPSLCRCYHQFE